MVSWPNPKHETRSSKQIQMTELQKLRDSYPRIFEISQTVILNLVQDLTRQRKNEMLKRVQHDIFLVLSSKDKFSDFLCWNLI